MIPIRPDIMLGAILSGSRLHPQNRARQFFARQMRAGGPRLHKGGERQTPKPDFDSKHLNIPEAPSHGEGQADT